MPGYIDEALDKFQYSQPKRQQYAPHAWTQPIYGVKFQYADNIDDSPALLPKTVRIVQKIVGTLLYYAIDINITTIVALDSISSTQSQATEKTYDETLWLLHYASTHPDANIRYSASNMILNLHSDALSLSEP